MVEDTPMFVMNIVVRSAILKTEWYFKALVRFWPLTIPEKRNLLLFAGNIDDSALDSFFDW